jgi:ribosome-associated protein
MAQQRARPLPSGETIARQCRDRLAEKLASDIVILDVRGLSTITDYFVICTGGSHRQVKTLADYLLASFETEGVRATHVEGLDANQWVVLDYIVAIVHIFDAETRAHYGLEYLWGDAPRVE